MPAATGHRAAFDRRELKRHEPPESVSRHCLLRVHIFQDRVRTISATRLRCALQLAQTAEDKILTASGASRRAPGLTADASQRT